MGEFNEVKRKCVHHSEPFSETTRSDLQHSVKNMLELDERTRSCSLENLVNIYVLDVELVYANLCVNSAIPTKDTYVLCAVDQEELKYLGTLFLLRNHRKSLKVQCPCFVSFCCFSFK